MFQPLVPALYGAFPTILFDNVEALPFAVRAVAYVGALRLRIEKKLYEGIGFACSMDGCGKTSRVGNSLACFLEVGCISTTFL